MSEVVMGIIARLRKEFGPMHTSDWEAYLLRCGVKIKYRDFSKLGVLGVVHGDTIFLQRDLPSDEMIETALHEFAHFSTHDGDIRWWGTRPQGHITVAKFERQAGKFAEMFPDRGE